MGDHGENEDDIEGVCMGLKVEWEEKLRVPGEELGGGMMT